MKDGQEPRGLVTGWDGIFAALLRGATLLTPNVRSARLWAARYDDAARRRSESSWQGASILPWRAWTASLWSRALVHGLDTRVLLNDLQERAVWRVITASSLDTLQSPDAQAKLCMGATRLLGEYDVGARFAHSQHGQATRSPDEKTFEHWYAEFEQVCVRSGFLPASHLEMELAALIRRGKIVQGGEYLLCGFLLPTPAQNAVFMALEDVGVSTQMVSTRVSPKIPPTLLQCGNPGEEMQQCAYWVRQQLESDRNRSIALVLPDPQASRSELERELRAIVAPETADVTRTGGTAPYEFAAGRPLQRLPMIADALRVLHWCAHEVSVLDAGTILRSRHLALAGSSEAGAELDVHVLRELTALRQTLTLTQAAAALARYQAGDRLLALDVEARPCRTARETFAWFTGQVRALLEKSGWPGPAELTSDEFQAVDRWNEVLDKLASLDLLGRKTKFTIFMAELQSLARETLFAPENVGAPVQVIGLAEAAGTTVDTLWFLHAHSNNWPPRPRPHALLPLRFQRELQMPGTEPARDEVAARADLSHLIESAGTACFSWSHDTGEDGKGTQQPSPLVEQAVLRYGGLLRAAEPLQEEMPLACVVSVIDAEPLPPLADERVSGGVGLLKAQAQCGFRAFAEKRLFATPMEQQDAGLSPGERGEQVHAVLQHFWNRVKDQRTLKKMAGHRDESGVSARDQLLRECISQAFQEQPGGAWESAYLQVQQQRLFRLLSDWLNLEAERPAFEVLQTEKQIRDVPVGPLRLSMRVDRVDRAFSASGDGTILIDYKTGAAAPAEWMGERPDEPQLPVYAVAGAAAAGLGQVEGIAFGGVRIGKGNLKLEGLAADPALLKVRGGKAVDFADQIEVWHRDLDRLAFAFAQGDASVDPKQYPATCDRCGQRMLCRVDAGALLQMEDLDESETDEAAAWT